MFSTTTIGCVEPVPLRDWRGEPVKIPAHKIRKIGMLWEQCRTAGIKQTPLGGLVLSTRSLRV
jgi:hypothetical protein